MARFILEVSDEYICEHADPEKMAEKALASQNSADAISAVLDVVAFGSIKRALDNGKREFTITADDMDDGKALEIFNSVVSRISALCIIKDANDKIQEAKG